MSEYVPRTAGAHTRTIRRTVENMTGEGTVWTGDQQLATVSYQLRALQQVQVTTSPDGVEETPRGLEIDGLITVQEGAWPALLTAPHAGLQLQLGDGRRLPISADGGGPTLRVRATGPFAEALGVDAVGAGGSYAGPRRHGVAPGRDHHGSTWTEGAARYGWL